MIFDAFVTQDHCMYHTNFRGRSSYFTVKDFACFTEFCRHWHLRILRKVDGMPQYAVVLPVGFYHPLVTDAASYWEMDIYWANFLNELSGHLADGETAVLEEIGWESANCTRLFFHRLEAPPGRKQKTQTLSRESERIAIL